VVAVFGRRAHGEWYPENRFRLTNMLMMSLGSGPYVAGLLVLIFFAGIQSAFLVLVPPREGTRRAGPGSETNSRTDPEPAPGRRR